MKKSTVRNWFVAVTVACAVATGVYAQREWVGTATVFGAIGIVTGLCYLVHEED